MQAWTGASAAILIRIREQESRCGSLSSYLNEAAGRELFMIVLIAKKENIFLVDFQKPE